MRRGIRQLLDDHNPTMLLLQEVPVYPDGSWWELPEIADLLAGFHLSYAPVHRVRRRSLYYPFDSSGLVTASRVPVADAAVIELPTVSRPKLGRHHLFKRIALRTRFEIGDRTVSVVNLHLENTTGPGGRMRQVERVLAMADDRADVEILGGSTTGNYHKVSRKLLNFDLWENDMLLLNVDHSIEAGDCPCCKHRSFDFLSGTLSSSAVSLCGRNAVQLRHRQGLAVLNLDAIAERLGEDVVKRNEFMLMLDVREQDSAFEISVFRDGRAIIKGTDDTSIARKLYAKFIGT